MIVNLLGLVDQCHQVEEWEFDCLECELELVKELGTQQQISCDGIDEDDNADDYSWSLEVGDSLVFSLVIQ